MRKNYLLLMLVMLTGMKGWGYRITDNYTIETKFKINDIAAGIAFAGYEGFGGSICMWQYSVGVDNNKSVLRPHDWRVGGILLEEKGTGDVTLNKNDWFVTRIVISNDGNHADTYLRRADSDIDVLIDSRDSRFNNEFRFGLIGTRQDHDGQVNESASYDYFKITDNSTGRILYFEDFETTNGNWRNDPIWADGVLTTSGVNLSERRYFPNNMFADAVDMHYAVDADVYIETGYLSFVFGLGENGSNYMWQLSPYYENQEKAIIYYHLDNGNENWKAHAASANFPDFNGASFINQWRHITIKVDANVVRTYIDGLLQNTFTQCDMTDLERLNDGGIGLRADGSNGKQHQGLVDNLTLTRYDAEGNVVAVDLYENFTAGVSRFFNVASSELTTVENGAFNFNTGHNGKFRFLQSAAASAPLVVSEHEPTQTLPVPYTTAVQVERTFTPNAWNTFCVPFALTAAQITDIFGDGTKIAVLSSVQDNVMYFDEATAIAAGLPVLIKPVNTPASFTADVTITEKQPQSVGNSDYQFIGTYSQQALSADGSNLFLLGNGHLATPAADKNVINGLRAYFQVPAGAQARVSLFDDETVTGITDNHHKYSHSLSLTDLQGRRANTTTRSGLYISNGKKIIIK